MDKTKILLVEDDPNLGFLLQENLEMHGFTVHRCSDGEQGQMAFKREQWDLCLLDVMLPKMDGFTLAADIRRQNEQTPILFLTAKSLKEDRITGLKLGADDYITNPFSLEELVLRIRAVLRRTAGAHHEGNSPRFQLGKLTFDAEDQIIESNGEPHKLTTKESELLQMLCDKMPGILLREQALIKIWGEDNYFTGRSMDVFISRLRKYLAAEKNVEIRTIHGKGFKLIIR